MAPSLKNCDEIHCYLTRALLEDSLSAAFNGEVGKTIDLNFPPANLNTFYAYTAIMTNCFVDQIKEKCYVQEKKRGSYGFDLNSDREESKRVLFVKFLSEPEGHDNGLSDEVDTMDLATLVCMGCKHCHMYFMVPKNAPKCPSCKDADMLDCSTLNHPVRRARMK